MHFAVRADTPAAPRRRAGSGAVQKPLGSAEELLRTQCTSRDTDALLAPAQALLHDDFWRPQLDGLAVFRCTDLLTHYRLPLSLPELAVVADTFHLKPLMQFLQSNRRFFVLALSQNHVALYEGTPDPLGLVDLPTLPASLTEALGVEQREAFLTLHASGTGKTAPMYHGHGVPPTENEKAALARFFRTIATALWEGVLCQDRAPLVLAALLDIADEQRATLRGWYERHAAYFRVVAVREPFLEVVNLLNEQPYTVRVEGSCTSSVRINRSDL